MSESTVIRNLEEFSAAFGKLKKLSDAKVVAPPTVEQLTARIEELGAALDAGTAAGPTLVGPIRAAVEAERANLIRQQYVLRIGFLPDAEGNPPIDEKAIAAKVIETISAAPEPLSTGLQPEPQPLPDTEVDEEADLDEQEKALNAIDEADTADVVSPVPQATIPAPKESLQMSQAVVLSSKDVTILRTALRANLTHIVLHVLSQALQEK